MGLSALLECWETGLRVFFKRPWFWLWMGCVSSLCWFGFPFGLAWLKTITTSGRADFDLITPGFLAQSVFVAATQWSCAAGMARLAREQLRDPKAKAVRWIEGFFGGFVTFPAAALAAWIYQETTRYAGQQEPSLVVTAAVGFGLLVFLVPLHEAYVAAVAEKGALDEIFTRMAASLRPSNLVGMLGMGGIIFLFAVHCCALLFTAAIVFALNLAESAGSWLSHELIWLIIIFSLSPVMAVYSLAWARFWQKSASGVPAQKDASP